MIIRNVILSFFVFLIVLGCEKEETIDKSYDCFKKEYQYNVNGELEYWIKHYYLNGLVVKYEDKSGNWTAYEYDENGNQTKLTTSNSKFIYQYDNLNNMVKMEYYSSGVLDYYVTSIYSGNQIMHSYQINNSNDTSSWSHFYYLNVNISHVESDDNDTYCYYSEEIDSVIVKRKNSSIQSKKFSKYLESKLIYRSYYIYDVNQEVSDYCIDTWEYENELLIRKTRKKSIYTNNYQYFDDRYIYNEINQKIKSEAYDELGNLIFYGLYLYDNNNNLYRFEGYSPDNLLTNYMKIEDSCN